MQNPFYNNSLDLSECDVSDCGSEEVDELDVNWSVLVHLTSFYAILKTVRGRLIDARRDERTREAREKLVVSRTDASHASNTYCYTSTNLCVVV